LSPVRSTGPAPASPRRIALPARAKLNLDLEVVCRRSDGLHELRTRMQAVELHDLLIAEPAEETTLTATGFELPAGGVNTVLAAHAEAEAAVGRPLPTSYRLHKRIPPGSGLGGASSDAAAALRALKSLHGLDLDLRAAAAHVGADVTFFLTGGSALVEGVGERVTPIELPMSWFALAWPGIELSTAAVYEAWDQLGALEAQAPNHLRAAAGRVDERLDRFAEHLGDGWQMTGSGSAFFLECPDRESAAAAVEKLDCWTAVTVAVGAWA
jgi:4-diphosphocytidyl-2C-methyl-D-erythritol kinase